MFFHIFKYRIKTMVGNRPAMFWMLCFPIILGTLFFIAFGSIHKNDEMFKAIPTAVVQEQKNPTFKTVLKQVSKGKDKLLSPKYMTKEEAQKKLKDGDVKGIIYVDEKLSLEVKAEGAESSILSTFLNQYSSNEKIIKETAEKDPTKLNDVISALSESADPIKHEAMTDGNTDPYVQYFYNLLAMACMFSAMAGLHAAISNKADCSQLAARKCVSPVHKLLSITASLSAITFMSFIINSIGAAYLYYALKIEFGMSFPVIVGLVLFGTMVGVSLGFFIGSVSKGSEDTTTGIMTAVSMFLCFLSGLMVGNMRQIVEQNAPIVNKINPAALIADNFYVINMYDTYDRLIRNLVTMAVITVLFTVGGFLLTRRKSYESL